MVWLPRFPQGVLKIIRQLCVGIENDSQTQEQQNDIKASRTLGLHPCPALDKPQKHTRWSQGNTRATHSLACSQHEDPKTLNRILKTSVQGGCQAREAGSTSCNQHRNERLEKGAGKDSEAACRLGRKVFRPTRDVCGRRESDRWWPSPPSPGQALLSPAE